MYICLCKGITDNQIREAIVEGGAASWRDVSKQLGVSSQCGKCAVVAKQVVDDALAEAAATFNPDLCYAVG